MNIQIIKIRVRNHLAEQAPKEYGEAARSIAPIGINGKDNMTAILHEIVLFFT
jgi:hypothetical protein